MNRSLFCISLSIRASKHGLSASIQRNISETSPKRGEVTRKMKKLLLSLTTVATLGLVAGCGTVNQTANQAAKQVQKTANQAIKTPGGVMVGATAYYGAANLKKFENAAKAQPKSEKAQMDAGISAFDNQQFEKAITYYQKAAQLNPKDPIPLNNIGNVYFRGLKQPSQALAYYKKATQIGPTYGVAWLNLYLVQIQLNQKQAAKQTLQQALKVVPKSNAYYSDLQKDLNSLK
ncbi:TPR repeat-containing protein [Alicyclobacillus tolerans]|uniref:TPR repeat-containing protein n=2 Tax=Alicyclobacillus tolerans TaxID=90970 RepID=A0A1M6MZY8_9BACL|nr:TPR repeat-containing protein [Alicyclobacillus montanus]